MYVTIDLLFLPYYQCKNPSIIVRQHDQGASILYRPICRQTLVGQCILINMHIYIAYKIDSNQRFFVYMPMREISMQHASVSFLYRELRCHDTVLWGTSGLHLHNLLVMSTRDPTKVHCGTSFPLLF